MLYEDIVKEAAVKYAAKKSNDAKARKAIAEAFIEGAKANERCKGINRKRTPERYDRRVKLPLEKRIKLKEMRERLGYTYQSLADMFGISCGYAQAICKPETLAKNKHHAKMAHRKNPQPLSMVKESIRYRRSLAAQGLM